MSLPLFTLKDYQLQTLASLRRFLEKTVELGDADTAFYVLTKRPFTPPPSLPGLPLKARLAQFHRLHEGEPIVADWPEDFVHLLYCLCEPNGVSQRIELDMRLIESGEIRPEIPHNALSDARALMNWHVLSRSAA